MSAVCSAFDNHVAQMQSQTSKDYKAEVPFKISKIPAIISTLNKTFRSDFCAAFLSAIEFRYKLYWATWCSSISQKSDPFYGKSNCLSICSRYDIPEPRVTKSIPVSLGTAWPREAYFFLMSQLDWKWKIACTNVQLPTDCTVKTREDFRIWVGEAHGSVTGIVQATVFCDFARADQIWRVYRGPEPQSGLICPPMYKIY